MLIGRIGDLFVYYKKKSKEHTLNEIKSDKKNEC